MTQRNQLDVLSCIRNIYKEVQKEIMYTLKYINDILLDINIELTYNTLISSKTIDQSLPEEEEKKVLEPPIDSPNIIYVKSISIPFITNLSISRFNSLSSKLKETTHLSELKDEVKCQLICRKSWSKSKL